MTSINALLSGGLLNRDAPDLTGLMTSSRSGEFKAFCTSRACIRDGGINDPTCNHRVMKDITDRAVQECPDCNHTLFWKQVRH